MDLARPHGRPAHRPVPQLPVSQRPILQRMTVTLLGIIVLLVSAPALALAEPPLSDVPAGVAEGPTLTLTVAGPELTEPQAPSDPGTPDPAVVAALAVDVGEVDAPDTAAPDAPTASTAPPTGFGPVRSGTPPDCFPSKEEYLDAWHRTGEAPDPVFCPPT